MNSELIVSIANGIIICRDDLFPKYYGGNKARKINSIEQEIRSRNNNAVVTTGGIQSNHCRVTAMMCAENQWKCKLILHGTESEFYNQKGNAQIMRMCGADIQFVDSQQISSAMDNAMNDFKNNGFSPYYLYGGGHNNFGVEAYVQAISELKNSLGSHFQPDHIFLASGTGSTQAGILVGLENVGWHNTKVHGISVARKKDRGINGIIEAISFVSSNFDSSKILFYDDYLFGGYGQDNDILRKFTNSIAIDTGLILDTTYTGKAYFGMIDLIKKFNLTGNIFFWHTGGLLNVMA